MFDWFIVVHILEVLTWNCCQESKRFKRLKKAQRDTRGEGSGFSDEEEFDGSGKSGRTAEEKLKRSLFGDDEGDKFFLKKFFIAYWKISFFLYLLLFRSNLSLILLMLLQHQLMILLKRNNLKRMGTLAKMMKWQTS